jgi:hypothetical protein
MTAHVIVKNRHEMSASVQVFGRLRDDASHGRQQQASEKPRIFILIIIKTKF